MCKTKRFYLIICSFLILTLAGCAKNLTYEGETANWKVVYSFSQDEERAGRQIIDIQSLGEEQKSKATFKAEFPRSACEMEFTLDNKGYKQLSTTCFEEPRADNKDDSFNVFISWGDQEEQILLKRQ